MKSHNLFILLAMIALSPHLSASAANCFGIVFIVAAIVFWWAEK